MAHPLGLPHHRRTRDRLATLFAWILAEAPPAELDASSRRTAEALPSKGSLS